jgi:hypothetical protein
MVREVILQQLDEVAASVDRLARSRAGRLVGLTLAVPPGMAPADVHALVEERLSRDGHAGLDISARPAVGPLRILTAEFLTEKNT